MKKSKKITFNEYLENKLVKLGSPVERNDQIDKLEYLEITSDDSTISAGGESKASSNNMPSLKGIVYLCKGGRRIFHTRKKFNFKVVVDNKTLVCRHLAYLYDYYRNVDGYDFNNTSSIISCLFSGPKKYRHAGFHKSYTITALYEKYGDWDQHRKMLEKKHPKTVFPTDGFGKALAFMAETIKPNETKGFLFFTNNHVMNLRIQYKTNPYRFVVNFWDPNQTNIEIRAIVENREDLQHIHLPLFLSDRLIEHYELQNIFYFQDTRSQPDDFKRYTEILGLHQDLKKVLYKKLLPNEAGFEFEMQLACFSALPALMWFLSKEDVTEKNRVMEALSTGLYFIMNSYDFLTEYAATILKFINNQSRDILIRYLCHYTNKSNDEIDYPLIFWLIRIAPDLIETVFNHVTNESHRASVIKALCQSQSQKRFYFTVARLCENQHYLTLFLNLITPEHYTKVINAFLTPSPKGDRPLNLIAHFAPDQLKRILGFRNCNTIAKLLQWTALQTQDIFLEFFKGSYNHRYFNLALVELCQKTIHGTLLPTWIMKLQDEHIKIILDRMTIATAQQKSDFIGALCCTTQDANGRIYTGLGWIAQYHHPKHLALIFKLITVSHYPMVIQAICGNPARSIGLKCLTMTKDPSLLNQFLNCVQPTQENLVLTSLMHKPIDDEPLLITILKKFPSVFHQICIWFIKDNIKTKQMMTLLFNSCKHLHLNLPPQILPYLQRKFLKCSKEKWATLQNSLPKSVIHSRVIQYISTKLGQPNSLIDLLKGLVFLYAIHNQHIDITYLKRFASLIAYKQGFNRNTDSLQLYASLREEYQTPR